jgi:hypothetical protein
MAFKIAKNISVTNTTQLNAIFYNWKQKAVEAGWQVMSSGTGSSGTGSGVYNASGDSISSSAILSNVNAWFRIRMPNIYGITREFVFQNSAGNAHTIMYSYSLGFTSGSPNASSIPTAGDGVYLNSGSSFTPGSDQTGFDLNCFVSVADGYNNDGYSSYMVGLKSTDKTAYFYMFFDIMQDGSYPTGTNTDPFVFSCSFNGANLPLTPSNISAMTASSQLQYGSIHSVNYFFLSSSDGTLLPQYGNNSNGGGIDSYMPIVAKSSGGTPSGTKGVSTLLRVTTANLSTGDTLTVTNNKDRIVIDQTILPWDGSNPIL